MGTCLVFVTDFRSRRRVCDMCLRVFVLKLMLSVFVFLYKAKFRLGKFNPGITNKRT
jgi:hypothetical protein